MLIRKYTSYVCRPNLYHKIIYLKWKYIFRKLLFIGIINSENIFVTTSYLITTSAFKLFIYASRPKTKEQFQSVNMCLQSSFAFFYVNFLCLLVKDNDKFLNQPTARSLLSNAKPRLHFYISIILLLHQFFAKMHGYNFNIKEPMFMRRTPTFNLIWLCIWSLPLHDLVLNIIIR